MSNKGPAPDLQADARDFFGTLGYSVTQREPSLLLATKEIAGGKELRWASYFEDKDSFSQLKNPREYVQQLLKAAADTDFFDLICTGEVFANRRWSEEVGPNIQTRFADGRNRQFGTWTAFLNRFAGKISAAQIPIFERIIEDHFIRRPILQRFTNGEGALRDCINWLDVADRRIMLVTGGPGAGKSVFAISLAKQMHESFAQEPMRYPAPFLVWFSTSRPAVLEDLIEVTLHDLQVHDLTGGREPNHEAAHALAKA